MFIHKLKYDLLSALRDKSLISWLILFPIGLAMLFKIGFGNIYDNEMSFSSIKTAIVEKQSAPALHTVTDEFAKEDEPFMTAVYTDEEAALKMLENSEVEGIIYADGELSLTVMKNDISQTILRTFIEEYNVQAQIIEETVRTDPAKAKDVIARLGESADVCTSEPLSEGNPDVYLQFFYNLIAMVGICGTITGVQMNSREIPKLTVLGARKTAAGMSSAKQSVANFLAACIAQSICVIIAVTFIRFVLGVELGDKPGLIYATAILGSATGISIGFFIGTLVKMPMNALTGIVWAGTMALCFLSGLMANMKPVINEKAPIVNEINPAALITDSLYCLNMYSDYERYIPKVLTLAAITAVFTVLTAVFSRRKSYASI